MGSIYVQAVLAQIATQQAKIGSVKIHPLFPYAIGMVIHAARLVVNRSIGSLQALTMNFKHINSIPKQYQSTKQAA